MTLLTFVERRRFTRAKVYRVLGLLVYLLFTSAGYAQNPIQIENAKAGATD